MLTVFLEPHIKIAPSTWLALVFHKCHVDANLMGDEQTFQVQAQCLMSSLTSNGLEVLRKGGTCLEVSEVRPWPWQAVEGGIGSTGLLCQHAWNFDRRGPPSKPPPECCLQHRRGTAVALVGALLVLVLLASLLRLLRYQKQSPPAWPVGGRNRGRWHLRIARQLKFEYQHHHSGIRLL